MWPFAAAHVRCNLRPRLLFNVFNGFNPGLSEHLDTEQVSREMSCQLPKGFSKEHAQPSPPTPAPRKKSYPFELGAAPNHEGYPILEYKSPMFRLSQRSILCSVLVLFFLTNKTGGDDGSPWEGIVRFTVGLSQCGCHKDIA